MNCNECQPLEDALAGALTPSRRKAFDAHLERCPTCRDAVESQRQFDQLLRQAVAELEPAPGSLQQRIEESLRNDRQPPRILTGRRKISAIGLAVAASIALVACGWMLWRGNSQTASNSVATENSPEDLKTSPANDPPTQTIPDPRTLVRIEPTDPTQAIYLPLKSSSPNVTIVWTYPTINAKRSPSEGID